jgi:diadenosine tetraphosphate (Ap4A) HIT family hydrolase
LNARRPFDLDAYVDRIRSRPCFICAMLAGDPAFAHHVVYEDEFAIAFLNKYPTLRGYTLVCPKAHREQVTGDFELSEYLRLQALVHAVGEALRKVFEAERIYVLSLGSQQGNRHVHWHVAPLPPGAPFEAQQFAALDVGAGVLTLDEAEMADIARRIAAELADYRVGTGVSPR